MDKIAWMQDQLVALGQIPMPAISTRWSDTASGPTLKRVAKPNYPVRCRKQ